MTKVQQASGKNFVSCLPYLATIALLNIVAVRAGIYGPHHIVLTLAMMLGLWPLYRYFRRRDIYNLFFVALTLINVIYYCVQQFLPLDYYESPLIDLIVQGTEESDMTAAVNILVGLTAFVAVGTLSKRLAVGRTGRVPYSDVRHLDHRDASRILAYLGVVYFIWLLILGVRVDVQYAAIVYAITLAGFFGVSVVVVLFYQQKLSRTAKAWLVCFLAIQMAIAIGSGFVAQVIQIILLIAFIYVAIRKRIPSGWFVVPAVGLVTILLMFKSLFRTAYWELEGPESGVVESAERFVGFVAIVIDNATSQDLGTLINAAALRVGMFHTFTYAATWTPTYIPFLEGSSYLPLLYKLVPRLILPDKPVEEMGQIFGHMYYFLDPLDDMTSVNLPLMIEMYINGGMTWVAGGMALVAVVNALVWRLISSIVYFWEARLAAYSLLFAKVALIEANFSLVYGGMLYIILFFSLVEFVVLRLFRGSRGYWRQSARVPGHKIG